LRLRGQRSEMLTIREAVGRHLDDLLARADRTLGTPDLLMGRLDEAIAWVSWAEIRDLFRREQAGLGSSSTDRAIRRVAAITLAAIKWHEDGVELPQGPRTPIVPPICMTCSHHRGDMSHGGECDAFPAGIPQGILRNEVDHRRPIDGDEGIQWEQDPAAPRLDRDYYDRLFQSPSDASTDAAVGHCAVASQL